jgi:TIR domain/Pentapeptide repeats (8 copies)
MPDNDIPGPDLTREQQIELLKTSVDKWNAWRAAKPGVNAKLSGTELPGADLSGADLSGADVSWVNLSEANLSDADLTWADLTDTDLHGASFGRTRCFQTKFVDVNLAQAQSLDTVMHKGSSMVSTGTLDKSKGSIPDVFLRGCGLKPWEVLQARLYDPTLSAADIAEIQQQIFDERTKGYFLSGIFISYSHDDAAFVEKLYEQLREEGANVWLDSRSAVAGPLEKQVMRAIRMNDVLLLVLSRSSLQSDWVEAELEWARDKEKQQQRDVLCPVALDASWQDKVKGSVLWRKVKDKNILDFSKWRTKNFQGQFTKLRDGLKVWYGPQATNEP